MKINYECLPCLVNQVVKLADMTQSENCEQLFKKVFWELSNMDFQKTNPEVIGMIFSLVKEHVGNHDPYYGIRRYYNEMFLHMESELEEKLTGAEDVLAEAIKYAIVGNVIDFNPVHNNTQEDILQYFDKMSELSLTVDDTQSLRDDLSKAKVLLYLGDNCGEICLDKILIKKIKEFYPELSIYFGVRGEAVVNDSIEEDAYFVGMDQYAKIISNGDQSLGTVLERTSEEFRQVYEQADIVIAKGQANYESLSEQMNKNIYYLLMVKCKVISEYIGIKQKSLVCKKGLRVD
ncbi:damage-control phosphatase ARMT1 family protein [Anaerosporobacter faecicola]|uniref:damage-control phosphatase ARMT1 family protein n=1 Tax=Anaerosporobacter faecicola TaxID=2718714 RepID=UPI001439682A|nr:ARMT1-like domain-containing protein [Anaerosporobacter faecicola]